MAGRRVGTPKTGGRQAGTPNKITASAREAFQLAFDESGGWTALTTWAGKNRTEFYKLYARLIPVEHTGKDGEPIATTVTHIYETITKAEDAITPITIDHVAP